MLLGQALGAGDAVQPRARHLRRIVSEGEAHGAGEEQQCDCSGERNLAHRRHGKWIRGIYVLWALLRFCWFTDFVEERFAAFTECTEERII